MSLIGSLKKVGRAIDPTSKSSPLGSLTRSAISFVPGGAAVLGAAGVAGSLVKGGGGKATPQAPAAPPAPSAGSRALSVLGQGSTQLVLLGVATVLVVVLLLKRK